MSRSLSELKSAIEEAHGWLIAALDLAVQDPEVTEQWPALNETVRKIEEAIQVIDEILPIHPEIEAAIKIEWEEMAGYESPEAMGLRP